MSDELPIIQVPESTWLRVLAHALDPEAEGSDTSLVPQDDDPQGDASQAAPDDVDPWDEPDESPREGSAGDAVAGEGHAPADRDDPEVVPALDGWGSTGGLDDVDDIAVVDGEAAVDTYTAALPDEVDGRDDHDDAGW